MTCPACTEAASHADCHSFNTTCQPCNERHFAHLQVFWESQKERRFTEPYLAALGKQFGEGAQAAHVNIKAWAERIKAARAVSA